MDSGPNVEISFGESKGKNGGLRVLPLFERELPFSLRERDWTMPSFHSCIALWDSLSAREGLDNNFTVFIVALRVTALGRNP
jgi:hypothetical protein